MAVVIEAEEVMKLILRLSIHKILLEIYTSAEPQSGAMRKRLSSLKDDNTSQ